jgi:hypothetical protein
MHPQSSSGGAKSSSGGAKSSSGGASTSAPRRDSDPQEEYETEQHYLLELLLDDALGVLTYREALTARVEDPDEPIRS